MRLLYCVSHDGPNPQQEKTASGLTENELSLRIGKRLEALLDAQRGNLKIVQFLPEGVPEFQWVRGSLVEEIAAVLAAHEAKEEYLAIQFHMNAGESTYGTDGFYRRDDQDGSAFLGLLFSRKATLFFTAR